MCNEHFTISQHVECRAECKARACGEWNHNQCRLSCTPSGQCSASLALLSSICTVALENYLTPGNERYVALLVDEEKKLPCLERDGQEAASLVTE